MIFVPALIAVVVSIAVIPLSIWVSHRSGTLDIPNSRNVHREPTPRLGGIAIAAAVASGVAGTFLYRYFLGTPMTREILQPLSAIGVAGVIVFVVGLVDDLRTVSSRFKLVALCGAAATVCGSGVLFGDLIFAGRSFLHFSWASWPVTALWIIGVAVAINFIDGLDGLAGGLTLMSASVLSLFTMFSGTPDVAILPLALCGSLFGFLCYNWHPAKTFMGDCGSMTIGFLLASSIVLANATVGTMRGALLPALALSIPIADTMLTLFRRHYQQRRSMFAAERGHIHHRLLDRGLSHRQTVLVIFAVSALAVGIGLVALSFKGWATVGGLALLIPVIWGTFQLAGSVRTNEMMNALRAKHELDRTAKRYRCTFEDMQLEFYHVTSFSLWWECVCRAAERLDFVHVSLRLPAIGNCPADSDGRDREMIWDTENAELALFERMQASLPIAMSDHDGPTATATIAIAATKSLESAGERLALFARLMTENSIAKLRRKERELRSRRSARNVVNRTHDRDTDRSGASYAAPGQFSHLRVAVVHDFLYTYCGAERVVEQIINLFPHCDLFSLFDFMPESQRAFLQGKSVTTSFIQNLPFARRKHRAFLPLMPLAIEQLDVSRYDLVISSSYLAAKGVLTGPDQLHVSYCHSPVRYAWDLHHQYMDAAGLGFGPKGLLARTVLHYIRSWDVRSSMGVDQFIANSNFVARRIKKIYRRNATVIHPPVDTEQFKLNAGVRDDFYLVAGRMVPYKRTDLIVNAFRQMPNRKLVLIGEGPDFQEVKRLAGPNVTVLGFQETDMLVDYMQRAKALIFAAEEDFGIIPVEALCCGTPVIAYGRGGVTESVVDGEHGVLFDEQTTDSVVDAIDRFESQLEFGKYDAATCRQRGAQFSHNHFATAITAAVSRWASQKWPTRHAFAPHDRQASIPAPPIDSSAPSIDSIDSEVKDEAGEFSLPS